MKRFAAYLCLLLAVLCTASGCGRVIPDGTLAQIYADMFVADQWVRDHPAARRTADTTFFYEPIFNSYGYTTEDYLRTVDRNLEDPESYAKILGKANDLLVERAEAQNEIAGRIQWMKDMRRIGTLARKPVFSLDSLSWLDSTYRWPAPRPDPAVLDTILDQTARADSLVRVRLDRDIFELDSLAASNPLHIDTLPQRVLKRK